MLKKSTSGVLASLRGSTYRSVRLASSLAAALLDGLFVHPEHFDIGTIMMIRFQRCFCIDLAFLQSARSSLPCTTTNR
jgi:hypothetical protein